jgi:hypothetical protein
MRLSWNCPLLVFPQICVNPRNLEGLRLAEATRPSTFSGEPAELDQPRLLGRQLQAELRQPSAKIGQEALSLIPILETDHVIVSEARDDHVTTRVPPPPLVGPQVEHVVEVDVREQR